jgi:acetyl esterase/lipase
MLRISHFAQTTGFIQLDWLFFHCFGLAWICVGPSIAAAQKFSDLDETTKEKLLARYPDADEDGDGKLSETEALQYMKKMRKGGTAKNSKDAAGVKPTFADVEYGPHERNKLDFWKAESDKPTPLVVFIHGGGFVAGDKSQVPKSDFRKQCLEAGVSFAAINYRFRSTAPIQDVLRDCARAVQFMRSKSSEWNIDKSRVGCFGGSAGAGTSMWLAFHDDLQDPNNADPVLRESSRICCAGSNSGQFSYDVVQWQDKFGEETTKRFADRQAPNEFYGLNSIEDLYKPEGLKVRADCDICGLLSNDDAPVFLECSRSGEPINDKGAFLHHPLHSKFVLDRCRELGIEAVADLPGLGIRPEPGQPQTLEAFFFKHLKVAK